jgi:PAN domain
MSNTSEGGKSGGTFQAIIVAVVIALVAGGSSPWWWSKIFPEHPLPLANTPSNAPDSKHSNMGPLEGGTNRQGNDLYKTGVLLNSPIDCSNLCALDDNCKAMTFVKHVDANGGICWLKGSVPSPSVNQWMVSAVKK